MYKLLTEEHREKVAREYALRRGVVMLAAFVVVVIIGIAELFPSFVLSNVREREVLERVRLIGSAGIKEDDEALQKWLSQINLKLRALSPELDTDRPSLVFEHILSERRAGIKLTSLAWVKEGGNASLSVSGVAQDRQTLIAFEERLKSSGHFSAVTLPVSNLAKDKDIDFELKLSPAQTP